MRLSVNELDGLVELIPNDLEISKGNFLIDLCGVIIPGRWNEDGDLPHDLSVKVGMEDVELSRFEHEVLSTVLMAKIQLI